MKKFKLNKKRDEFTPLIIDRLNNFFNVTEQSNLLIPLNLQR